MLPDFLPTAPWRNLRLRAELLSRLRRFFDERGFLEVETPLLSADIVVDRHLDPFGTILAPDPRRPEMGRRLWLQTSPEFGMKRLLAAVPGDPDAPRAIYQVTRSFRNGEQGDLHNPEFTIVEWYGIGDNYSAAMRLTDELCQTLLHLGPAERLTYAQAFERHVGLNPHVASVAQLAAAARVPRGVAIPESMVASAGREGDCRLDESGHYERAANRPDESGHYERLADRDAWLNLLLAALVEPHLGQAAPTLLCDYPTSQAALARVRPGTSPLAGRASDGDALPLVAPSPLAGRASDGSPLPSVAEYPVAERFELYVRGIELANGYHELLDPDELSARMAGANAARVADGKPPLPTDNRLLTAMRAGLPPCCGVALGFDRLVLLSAGADRLSDVMPFPIDRA